MTARLESKVAIVTGAGSGDKGVGVGEAIATLLARESAKVCIVDLDEARAERTRAAIQADGGEAVVAVADVTDSDACRRVVEQAVTEFHRVDVLVNNVGITGGPPVEHVDEIAWERMLAVNLKSALLMSKYAIPKLREAGGGSIINISSVASLLAYGGSAYGPSKAALNGLTRDMALVYGRDGIRVNAIAPGHVYTPLVAGITPEVRERRRKVAPLGIEGTAWDVAWAAVYLASDEARFVSGVVLPVDGGATQILPLRGYDLITE